MKDYDEDSFLCTPEGKLSGLVAIRVFFTEVFKLFPKGQTRPELKQMISDDDLVYIAWNDDSAVAEVPVGTDSFKIQEGRIIWQTMAAHIIDK